MRIYCPDDKKMVEDRGLVRRWERVSGSYAGKEIEREYRQLSCHHELFVRDTGRTRARPVSSV